MRALVVILFLSTFCQPSLGADCLKPAQFENFQPDYDVSAVTILDFDQDGCDDVIFFTSKKSDIPGTNHHLYIDIASTHSSNVNFKSQRIKVGEVDKAANAPDLRDSSNNLFVIEDFNSDGHLDIVSAYGIVWLDSNGQLVFSNFINENGITYVSLLPSLDFNKETSGQILRMTPSGHIELCDNTNGCVEKFILMNQLVEGDPGEMASGDFDGDGQLDFIFGTKENGAFAIFSSYNTKSTDSTEFLKQENLIQIPHMENAGVDIRVVDYNGDGLDDLVAQRREYISDFQSDTELFLSQFKEVDKDDPLKFIVHGENITMPEFTGGSGGGFNPFSADWISSLVAGWAPLFTNYDNHNDAAEIADYDGDGCLDYLQAGVDRGIAITKGKCSAGPVDWPVIEVAGARMEKLSSQVANGIQCLPINDSEKCYLFVRTYVSNDTTSFLKLRIFREE